MSPFIRAAKFITAFALVGCGGATAFSPTFPDNRTSDLEAIAARLEAPVDRPAIAVGITGEPHRIYAWQLAEGRLAWEQPVDEPGTAPWIAGDLVVLQEGQRVVGRRLTDGSVAFARELDRLHLIGAGGDGPVTAIVLSTAGGVGAQSRILIAQNGGIAHQLEVDGAVGSPDVRSGLVFVPWGNQNVSVVDAATGLEIARARFMDGVVGHARASGTGVYFGQTGVGRFGPALSRGTREEAGWVQPDASGLPGQAPLWRNAYEPPQGPRSATHKIRLAWTPVAGDGPVRFTDDALYLTFYRLLFVLAPGDLAVRSVHAHPTDLVGAEAHDGGVLVADAAGGITALAADGSGPRWTVDTGREPTAVAFRLGSFRPPMDAGEPPPPLANQLLAVAQNTDTRLLPARAFAVRAIAAQPGAEVTEHLIVLCDDRGVPAELRRVACQALSNREVGPEAVLAALGRHASFLEETAAPPVGPLATVAARLGERRAIPMLVAHLRDPHTPAEHLAPIADALARFGDSTTAEPLRAFLWLYHADGEDEELARGLGAVARALVAVAGPPGREDVEAVMEAPFTTPTVRGQLAAALRTEPAAANP